MVRALSSASWSGVPPDILPIDENLALRWCIDAADQVEQRGFTAPGRAGDGEKDAVLDVQRDILQGMDLLRAHLVVFENFIYLDDARDAHARLLPGMCVPNGKQHLIGRYVKTILEPRVDRGCADPRRAVFAVACAADEDLARSILEKSDQIRFPPRGFRWT